MQSACHGTVFLEHIDALSSIGQSILYQSIISPSLWHGRVIETDIRYILSSSENLYKKVQSGSFLPELYHIMACNSLVIPPLRSRVSDIRYYAEHFTKILSTKNFRLNVLSQDSLKLLSQYPWPGNVRQLYAFCGNLTSTAPHKIISAEHVQEKLDIIFPQGILLQQQSGPRIITPEALMLQQLLEELHWNKDAVAKELHISKSTLWRRMKKYNL